MIKNKTLKRILAFALCTLLFAGMTPESLLAAEAGEGMEESAGISGNEAAKEPVSDNKTAPDTGKVSPGDDDEGMTPSENEGTEPVGNPPEIPGETIPEDTVSENKPEETVSEDDISEAVSDNEISETVSENETEEPAGNPGTWANVIKVALDNGNIYYGGADAPSGVSYDANTHTLTLDNFKNEHGYIKEGIYSYSGIYADGDLIIEVKGDCVVKPKPENAGLGGADRDQCYG